MNNAHSNIATARNKTEFLNLHKLSGHVSYSPVTGNYITL
jgi:hypothetical protein